jgi:hypothetical protein
MWPTNTLTARRLFLCCPHVYHGGWLACSASRNLSEAPHATHCSTNDHEQRNDAVLGLSDRSCELVGLTLTDNQRRALLIYHNPGSRDQPFARRCRPFSLLPCASSFPPIPSPSHPIPTPLMTESFFNREASLLRVQARTHLYARFSAVQIRSFLSSLDRLSSASPSATCHSSPPSHAHTLLATYDQCYDTYICSTARPPMTLEALQSLIDQLSQWELFFSAWPENVIATMLMAITASPSSPSPSSSLSSTTQPPIASPTCTSTAPSTTSLLHSTTSTPPNAAAATATAAASNPPKRSMPISISALLSMIPTVTASTSRSVSSPSSSQAQLLTSTTTPPLPTSITDTRVAEAIELLQHVRLFILICLFISTLELVFSLLVPKATAIREQLLDWRRLTHSLSWYIFESV